MTFHNRWFTGPKRKVITEALGIAPRIGAVLEIGCWEGHSSVWLANQIWPQQLHCFDWWLGSPDGLDQIAKERDVYADFIDNMQRLTKCNYTVWKGDWRETLPRWPSNRPIRFAFIDATHTYDEVKDNIEALLPLLIDRAVLSGDDFYGYPEVGRAVQDTLAARGPVIAPHNGHGAWYWQEE